MLRDVQTISTSAKKYVKHSTIAIKQGAVDLQRMVQMFQKEYATKYEALQGAKWDAPETMTKLRHMWTLDIYLNRGEGAVLLVLLL